MCSTSIDISQLFEGWLPRTRLLEAQLTFAAWISLAELTSGGLLCVRSDGFILEAGIVDGTLVLTRNGFTAKRSLVESTVPNIEQQLGLKRPCHITFVWEPTRIAVSVNGEQTEVITPPTLPPNSLVAWARAQAIVPITLYESQQAFRDTLVNGLEGLQDKIERMNAQVAFWDIITEENKIVSRRPKRETHFHSIIHGLLHDFAIAKNIEIQREVNLGAGKLDFLFCGTLGDGKTVKACLEFKRAHSADVDNGLIKQLPDYMRACGTDIGFFGVVWYKGTNFEMPSMEIDEFRGSLIVKQVEAGLANLNLVFIDVSGGTPPSARRATNS